VGPLAPVHAPYARLMAGLVARLEAMGHGAAGAQRLAEGWVLHALGQQASTLAYADVFALTAVVALAVVPLTFLFRGSVATGRG
ncbi:MAG: hypothetical protein ACP5NI_11150, partial [Acetobacteraceae bacterium]